MDMKLILLIGLFGLLIMAGCTEPEEETCPEGFILVDGVCQQVEDSTPEVNELMEEESVLLNGWNITILEFNQDVELSDDTCEASEQEVKISAIKGEEEVENWYSEGSEMELPDGSIITINDIMQIVDKQDTNCKATSKKVNFEVYSPNKETETKSLALREKYDLYDGRELEMTDIDAKPDYVDSWERSAILEEGEYEVFDDIDHRITIEQVTEDIETEDWVTVNVTRDEGEQATLPGDYVLRVLDIDQTIATPDTNVITEDLEEGDDIVLGDDTVIRFYDLNFDINNCSAGCTTSDEVLTLRVWPEDDSSYEIYDLEEGEDAFVSDRVHVEVLSIDIDTDCDGDGCDVNDETVTLRVTTYANTCPVSNREVELELLFPDLTTETVTLDYGSEYEFVSGEKLEVISMDEDLEDSVEGTCEVDDESVTIQATVSSTDCAASDKRAKIRVRDEDLNKDYTVTVKEGTNETIKTNFGELIVVVNDIDVDLEKEGTQCVVEDETVDVTLISPARCTLNKKSVSFEIDGTKKGLNIDKETESGDLTIKLKDITADVDVDEDDESCDIDNLEAELLFYLPTESNINIKEGENSKVNDLDIIVNSIDVEFDNDCEPDDVVANITFIYSGVEDNVVGVINDDFLIDDYTVNILDIPVTTADGKAVCKVSSSKVKFTYNLASANTVSFDLNETNETNITNETESIENQTE